MSSYLPLKFTFKARPSCVFSLLGTWPLCLLFPALSCPGCLPLPFVCGPPGTRRHAWSCHHFLGPARTVPSVLAREPSGSTDQWASSDSIPPRSHVGTLGREARTVSLCHMEVDGARQVCAEMGSLVRKTHLGCPAGSVRRVCDLILGS